MGITFTSRLAFRPNKTAQPGDSNEDRFRRGAGFPQLRAMAAHSRSGVRYSNTLTAPTGFPFSAVIPSFSKIKPKRLAVWVFRFLGLQTAIFRTFAELFRL